MSQQQDIMNRARESRRFSKTDLDVVANALSAARLEEDGVLQQ